MTSSGLKAVLWDFGGVLTTGPFHSFAAYERANGLPPAFIRGLNATRPDTNAWARYERAEISVDEFIDLFEAEAVAAGATIDGRAVLAAVNGEIRPEMVEALRRCHTELKTALLTNNFASPAEAVEASEPSHHAPVLEHFDVIVESSKVGCRKPDPRFYEIALELLHVDPSQAVYLDDLGINLKPARAMGMHTIKVTDPAVALAELQEAVGFPLS